MNCPNCHKELPNEAKFCLHCGAKIEVDDSTIECPSCHARIPKDSKFCPDCGTKIRIINENFEKSIPIPYKAKNGLYGFKNKDTDEIVVHAIFEDRAEFYEEGIAVVKINDGKYGIINFMGDIVIPFEYDEIGELKEGLLKVRKGSQWGFCNLTGVQIVPCKFEFVEDFKQGTSCVCVLLNEKFGKIDKSGNILVPFQFQYVGDMENGGYPVWLADDIFGYTDAEGKGSFRVGEPTSQNKMDYYQFRMKVLKALYHVHRHDFYPRIKIENDICLLNTEINELYKKMLNRH